MKIKYILLILAALSLISTQSFSKPAKGGKNSTVSYAINAELNTREKLITASETIRWRNTSKKGVSTMRFHLYYNAFMNNRSTFLREDGWHKKTADELEDVRFGGISVKSVRIKDGPSLTGSITYPAPDDGNSDDKTVMQIRLPGRVGPGGEITVVIDFTVKIPDIISRTGEIDDYYFIAQWYPKPGVLQNDGTWHCHQYHYNAEYFADYGDFRVSLTLPSGYTAGATGNLEKELKNSDGTITRIYEEESIHDFAWTAWPEYKKDVSEIKLPRNKDKTTVEILYAPRHGNALERNKKSLRFAMDFYAKYIFPYPYKKITLVDAPMEGMESWGMEYPTFITTAHVPFAPEFYRLAEKVTIHEFGHQYWYGIIGFDETREAWLDEGLNTFFEMEIMEAYFKGEPSFLSSPPFNLYDWQDRRSAYTSMAHVDPAATLSWEFMDYSTYRGNVYTKTALLMLSLKNITGQKKLYSFFSYFLRKWKFKHPTGEDFIKDFNKFMRKDYSWAFDQFIKDHMPLDQAIYNVESTEVNSKKGKFDNEIILIRQRAWFPVDLLITFTDGSTKEFKWSTPEPWKRINFYSKNPIASAVLDPEYKIPLDKNFINNSVIIEKDYRHFGDFIQNLGTAVQTLLSFLIF